MPDFPSSLRDQLDFVRSASLTYGPWRRFKSAFKQADNNPQSDPALLGELFARIDAYPLVDSIATPNLNLGRGVSHVNSVAVTDEWLFAVRTEAARRRSSSFLNVYSHDVTSSPLEPKLLGQTSVNRGTCVACGRYVGIYSKDPAWVAPGCLATLFGWVDTPMLQRLSVFDCNDPKNIRNLGESSFNVNSVVSDGLRIFVSHRSETDGGVTVLDPALQSKRILINLDRMAQIAVSDDKLYATFKARKRTLRTGPVPAGMNIYQLEDDGEPKPLGSIKLGNPDLIAVQGNTALVVHHTGFFRGQVLSVIDVETPSQPRILTSVPLPKDLSWPDFLSFASGNAYIGQSGRTTYTVDLTDRAKPKIARAKLPENFSFSTTDQFAALVSKGSVWLVDRTSIARTIFLGTVPKRKTFAYMKRRARRDLKELERTDGERFLQVAFETLSRIRGDGVDPTRQWVAMDLLYGGSDLYRQSRHGRGSYNPTRKALMIRRRLERGQGLWQSHPDRALALLQTPDLAWPVYEMAFRILLETRPDTAFLDAPMAARFVAGDSGLLVHYGKQLLMAAVESSSELEAQTAADLYLCSNGRARKVIADAFPTLARASNWRRKFADRLVVRCTRNMSRSPLTRRQSSALVIVATQFLDVVPTEKLAEYSHAFLQSGQLELIELAYSAARKESPAGVGKWLDLVAARPDEIRLGTVDALADAVKGKSFSKRAASKLVTSQNEFVRWAAWKILDASATPARIVQDVQKTVMAGHDSSPALRTMLTSGSGIALLVATEEGLRDLMRLLAVRPELSGFLTPEVLASVVPELSSSDLVRLIGAAPDELWYRLRAAGIYYLREGFGEGLFWPALAAELGGEHGETLKQRVLDDSDLAEVFVETEDEGLLAIQDPAFGPLLTVWVQRRADRFAANSPLLLAAATHRVAEVRNWGLQRLKTVGMDYRFALRLLESELPPSFDAGRTVFDSVTPQDLTTFAMAVCDSPIASVRAFGRNFVRAHWDELPHYAVLSSLFESDSSDMQGFTAGLLAAEAQSPAATAAFDRDVLRTRSRSRRAKELVKQRQEADRTLDIATLVIMARSSVPSDAEWALSQLAQRVVSGAEIDGIEIDGVTGG